MTLGASEMKSNARHLGPELEVGAGRGSGQQLPTCSLGVLKCVLATIETVLCSEWRRQSRWIKQLHVQREESDRDTHSQPCVGVVRVEASESSHARPTLTYQLGSVSDHQESMSDSMHSQRKQAESRRRRRSSLACLGPYSGQVLVPVFVPVSYPAVAASVRIRYCHGIRVEPDSQPSASIGNAPKSHALNSLADTPPRGGTTLHLAQARGPQRAELTCGIMQP